MSQGQLSAPDGDLEGPDAGRGPGQNPKKKKPFCRFFNQRGGCKKGDQCPFAHVPRRPHAEAADRSTAAAVSEKKFAEAEKEEKVSGEPLAACSDV